MSAQEERNEQQRQGLEPGLGVGPVMVEAIWISPGHDFAGRHGKRRAEHAVVACEAVACVAGRGLEGDRYFDHREDYKGQLTLFSAEVVESLRAELGYAVEDPSVFRRNILVRGIDLNTLIGKRFRLGEVELTGSEESKPCHWMEVAVGAGAHAWLRGRGGLRCRILKSGTLVTGKCPLVVHGAVGERSEVVS